MSNSVELTGIRQGQCVCHQCIQRHCPLGYRCARSPLEIRSDVVGWFSMDFCDGSTDIRWLVLIDFVAFWYLDSSIKGLVSLFTRASHLLDKGKGLSIIQRHTSPDWRSLVRPMAPASNFQTSLFTNLPLQYIVDVTQSHTSKRGCNKDIPVNGYTMENPEILRWYLPFKISFYQHIFGIIRLDFTSIPPTGAAMDPAPPNFWPSIDRPLKMQSVLPEASDLKDEGFQNLSKSYGLWLQAASLECILALQMPCMSSILYTISGAHICSILQYTFMAYSRYSSILCLFDANRHSCTCRRRHMLHRDGLEMIRPRILSEMMQFGICSCLLPTWPDFD